MSVWFIVALVTLMPEPKEVFVSYSWDSEEHINNVLALFDRLRLDGIDCVLDQYEVSPPEGWPQWMDRKIASASLVLVICTKTYFNRVMGYEDTDKGMGVKWESGAIYQHLYNAGSNNQRFIPVLMKDDDKGFIPVPLQGASYFAIDTGSGYKRLYNRLLGRAPAERPPLGQIPPYPPKEVKTDFATYVASPINVSLWDQAQWRATVFGQQDGSSIPFLGLGFLNQLPAQKIFEDWQCRYGDWDEKDELRIAVVEGEIRNKEPGYSVHVGLEYEQVMERYRRAGLEVARNHSFAAITRIQRMDAPNSPHLRFFKQAYKRAGEYLLIPASCKPDGSNLSIAPRLGIRKKIVHFRDVADVGPNDIDAAIFLSHPD